MVKTILGQLVLLITIFSILIPSINITFAQYSPAENPLPSGFHEGPLSGNAQVIASIYIPLRNLNELYYYAEEVNNPGSSLYHKFLTPKQAEEMFYPTSQFNRIMSYLRSQDVHVLFTAANSVIVVEGTASQLSRALGVHYVLIDNGTTYYYTSVGTPKIPASVISSNLSAILFSHPSTLFTQNDVDQLIRKIGSVNVTSPIEGYSVTSLRGVYNVSSLISNGINGSGYTIGILDFYGDPYVQQQLSYFDKLYDIPSPPNFSVIPIGPYDPNLGITTNWAGEISLDVESSHAMAPGANIVLYVANPNLPLSSIIANIVSQDSVDTLSQSFSIPDELFPTFSSSQFYQCVVETDQYYALGNAEGITFLASSGDGGGSGYSAGPLGSVGYPSTSPFVTAVGGTTTYLTFNGFTFNVTAWSNYGFVPPNVNYGGSTGGISQVEPKPYYQWGLTTPQGYPGGREIPDVSANADVYPGIFIVCPNNVTAISGGTSEASPLMAGLLTIVMQYDHTRLGNINPALYKLQESAYSKVFYPITFGYNIPWTASYGYNLVTGLGQLNVGNFASLYNEIKPSLSIMVNVSNNTFYPGQLIKVEANITLNSSMVNSGEFYVTLSTVYGNVTTLPLTFNPSVGEWTAEFTVPTNDLGVTFITVWGRSTQGSGYGMTEAFSGYFVQFLLPSPYSTVWSGTGIPVIANVTNVFGQLSNLTSINLNVYSYNITNNSYTLVNETTLTFNPVYRAWTGVILGNEPAGPLLIEATNAFGYDAVFNGIGLTGIMILPPTIAEPGTVYPGQQIIIQGTLTPPANVPSSTLSNIPTGSNLTAELLFDGNVVSKSQILYSTTGYLGYLTVPSNARPGLYTVLLLASYDSYTLGQIVPGFYYGQIYVGDQAKVGLSFSDYAIQGSTLFVRANITVNGEPVKYGMFSATVFPMVLSGQYSLISTLMEIPLWYNSSLGLWTGNLTLPSTLSLGNFTYLGNSYYAEPFRVLATGVTAYGAETSTALSYSRNLFVLPYTLIQNDPSYSSVQTYDAAFSNVTLRVNGELINDLFISNNTLVDSHVTISSSNVSGTLTLVNTEATMIDVQANKLVLVNSSVTLVNSIVQNLIAGSSLVSPMNSVIVNVYPSLPTVQIGLKPYQNLTGNVSFPISVEGEVNMVIVKLDGNVIGTFTTNGTHDVTLNTLIYPDGTHEIQVVAEQPDGLNTTFTQHVVFSNQIESLNGRLNDLNSTVNARLNDLNSTVQSGLSSVHSLANYGIALGIIALILAIIGVIGVTLRRK
ncbi:MAG: protease pro-enzyme activation domain-containing protein [Metallosphaera sp.]|uniref:S53 family peptidase n=1 Tax=Metallosphaera sp. TaxID=2020860 RepID=UPI00316019ED